MVNVADSAFGTGGKLALSCIELRAGFTLVNLMLNSSQFGSSLHKNRWNSVSNFTKVFLPDKTCILQEDQGVHGTGVQVFLDLFK